MGLFDHSAAPSGGSHPDPSRSDYHRLSDLVARFGLSDPSHHAGSSERAAVELIGRFAHAEHVLARPPDATISTDEARARWKLGVIEVVRQFIPEAQQVAHHDYDQAVGMLGMVRSGQLGFTEAVDQIKHSSMSPQLDAVIKGLRLIHSVAGYDPHALDPQATLEGFTFKSAAREVNRPVTSAGAANDEQENIPLDQAFARDAILLMRLIHPLGLCPVLNIAGRTRMGFAGDRGGIDFGSRLGSVEIESNRNRTKITYTPSQFSENSERQVVRIHDGGAVLLGRPLHVGRLFGIGFEPVSLDPPMRMVEKEISRAAYLIVRDERGGVYLFDRGARHSFGFWENYDGRERRYRFDPRATLKNDGRFTTGHTHVGSEDERRA